MTGCWDSEASSACGAGSQGWQGALRLIGVLGRGPGSRPLDRVQGRQGQALRRDDVLLLGSGPGMAGAGNGGSASSASSALSACVDCIASKACRDGDGGGGRGGGGRRL